MRSFDYSSLDTALPRLAGLLDRDGWELDSRIGKTKEVSFVNFTIRNPLAREILAPARKASLVAQIAETMWVLSGRNDVEWLSNYLPRAGDYSDNGKIWRGAYGPRIREWRDRNDDPIDQLAHVVELLKSDPETRRAVIQIYDPAIDTAPGKDIPCNNWLSFLARAGRLDLHVATRSNDLIWGWSGINQFEWSTLLEIVAGLTGLEVGSIHYSITSLHAYERHFDKLVSLSKVSPQDGVDWASSPRFGFDSANTIDHFDGVLAEWFRVEEMIRTRGAMAAHPDLENFPEPMLKSWLRVLQWWHSGGDWSFLQPLEGTRLYRAAELGVQPKTQLETTITIPPMEFSPGGVTTTVTIPPMEFSPVLDRTAGFVSYVSQLHNEKHAAYGDSWKRRGEMLGILANIARKIDRLGGADTTDETAVDTAIDLMVYLAKYRLWLCDEAGAVAPRGVPVGMIGYSDDPGFANKLIAELVSGFGPDTILPEQREGALRASFEQLEAAATSGADGRVQIVNQMLNQAVRLARSRWSRQQWRKGNANRSWGGYL